MKQREYKHNKQFFQTWTDDSFCSTTPQRKIGGYVWNTSTQSVAIMSRKIPMMVDMGIVEENNIKILDV